MPNQKGSATRADQLAISIRKAVNKLIKRQDSKPSVAKAPLEKKQKK